MKVHIGNCDCCPATDVRIAYGWSTLKKLCCICNSARLRKAKSAKSSVRAAGEKKARHIAAKQQKPIKPPKPKKPRLPKKPIKKKVTKSRRTNLEKDAILNKEIWKKRKHACYECLRPLDFPGFPEKRVFSHVHGKGAHPALRHVKLNVVLHCFDCHDNWEGGKRETMPNTLQLFERIAVEFKDNRFNRK